MRLSKKMRKRNETRGQLGGIQRPLLNGLKAGESESRISLDGSEIKVAQGKEGTDWVVGARVCRRVCGGAIHH